MQNMNWNVGGLTQMNYNNYATNDHNNTNNAQNTLAPPASGYAYRGKASHVRHLSLGPVQNNEEFCQENNDTTPTPRTSRSHLLAGLRTTPRSPNPSASPLYPQQQYHASQSPMLHSSRHNTQMPRDVPQTAAGNQLTGFGRNATSMNGAQQMYSTPDQVLAPPSLELGHLATDQVKTPYYDELMATNQWLMQRQQQLQQQLVSVTNVANQLNSLSLAQRSQYEAAGPSVYGQQLQSGLQPIIHQVPNQPGVYSVYNPMTGQQSYFVDQAVQNRLPVSPSHTSGAGASQDMLTPSRPQRSGLATPQSVGLRMHTKSHSVTPPHNTPSPPLEVTPLPTPSANAFRPSHKKGLSAAVNSAGRSQENKELGGKAVLGARTPLTNNFGVGMARVSDLPSRQPRGPPPMEELLTAPTMRYEGCKNFASRQRSRALQTRLRADNERLSGRSESGEGVSLGSETELPHTTVDHDSDNSLAARPSIGSLRAVANGAIGSERKASKERSRERSTGMRPASTRLGSADELSFAHKLMKSKPPAQNDNSSNDLERRRTPMLVLTSAEKRKTAMY